MFVNITEVISFENVTVKMFNSAASEEGINDSQGALIYIVIVLTVYSAGILGLLLNTARRKKGTEATDEEVSEYLKNLTNVHLQATRQDIRLKKIPYLAYTVPISKKVPATLGEKLRRASMPILKLAGDLSAFHKQPSTLKSVDVVSI